MKQYRAKAVVEKMPQTVSIYVDKYNIKNLKKSIKFIVKQIFEQEKKNPTKIRTFELQKKTGIFSWSCVEKSWNMNYIVNKCKFMNGDIKSFDDEKENEIVPSFSHCFKEIIQKNKTDIQAQFIDRLKTSGKV